MTEGKKISRGPWYETPEAATQATKERARLAAVEWLRANPGPRRAMDLAEGIGLPHGAAARLVVAHPAYFRARRAASHQSATHAMTVELHPHLAAVLA